jgi:hypothetical protein
VNNIVIVLASVAVSGAGVPRLGCSGLMGHRSILAGVRLKPNLSRRSVPHDRCHPVTPCTPSRPDWDRRGASGVAGSLSHWHVILKGRCGPTGGQSYILRRAHVCRKLRGWRFRHFANTRNKHLMYVTHDD